MREAKGTGISVSYSALRSRGPTAKAPLPFSIMRVGVRNPRDVPPSMDVVAP